MKEYDIVCVCVSNSKSRHVRRLSFNYFVRRPMSGPDLRWARPLISWRHTLVRPISRRCKFLISGGAVLWLDRMVGRPINANLCIMYCILTCLYTRPCFAHRGRARCFVQRGCTRYAKRKLRVTAAHCCICSLHILIISFWIDTTRRRDYSANLFDTIGRGWGGGKNI